MKTALIFQGGWEGHEPAQIAEMIKAMLEAEAFSVEVHDNFECLADAEKLAALDLIVPAWTNGDTKPEYVQNVCDAVENGTGIAGCHGGMCDTFRYETQWQHMTGSQWVAHPGNDGVEYAVSLIEDDYFTKGLRDFTLVSEQYYLHVDPVVKVCATTRFPVIDGPHSPNGKVNMPVVYTKMWGKGRVFYSSLGHNLAVFDVLEAKEILRRGLLWAGRQA